MNKLMSNKLLIAFGSVVLVATFIRVFFIDIILVSNDSLLPDLYPGDLVFVSKMSAPRVGSWILLRNHPQQGVYSLRKVVSSDFSGGWNITLPATETNQDEKTFVETKSIKGRALFVIWSLPCKPSMVADGICPAKGSRVFKALN
jgi:hypothetical protein